jgi:transposase, IS30 family
LRFGGLRVSARPRWRDGWAVSSSTVNRELARNRLPSGGYQPSFAEGSYLARRERLALLERDEQLERFVIDRLTEGWSPEQVGGWLKAGNESGLRGLGTETIYRFETSA